MTAPEPVNFRHSGANHVYNIRLVLVPTSYDYISKTKSLEMCLLNGLIHSFKTRVIVVG